MMNLLYEIIKDNNLYVDRVVLVGGLAVSLYTGVEISKDVDFALVLDDYQKIQAMDEWGIKTKKYEWGSVDFLNPNNYVSKKHNGNEFITYVKQHRSFKKTETGELYIAKPEVVFYTRMVVPTWEGYINKCLRDLNVGLLKKKPAIIKGMKAIADVFGTRNIINNRTDILNQYIESYFH